MHGHNDVVYYHVAPGELREVRCECDPAEDLQVVIGVSRSIVYVNAAGAVVVREGMLGVGRALLTWEIDGYVA